MPPNLLDELKQDRRWCQGNLMNFHLFLARGMRGVHRAVFVNGVMVYISAPLWFGFLVLSTVLLAMHTLMGTGIFCDAGSAISSLARMVPGTGAGIIQYDGDLIIFAKNFQCYFDLKKSAREFGGALRLAIGFGKSVAGTILRKTELDCGVGNNCYYSLPAGCGVSQLLRL